MSKLNRIYHPYTQWEEISFNMWGNVDDKKTMLLKAIEFTGNHILYGEHMMRVAYEWRYSCENALTDYFLNRKAWIGHAACALAICCPEHITREAWGTLTNEQQLLANEKAEQAIQWWENNFRQSKTL